MKVKGERANLTRLLSLRPRCVGERDPNKKWRLRTVVYCTVQYSTRVCD